MQAGTISAGVRTPLSPHGHADRVSPARLNWSRTRAPPKNGLALCPGPEQCARYGKKPLLFSDCQRIAGDGAGPGPTAAWEVSARGTANSLSAPTALARPERPAASEAAQQTAPLRDEFAQLDFETLKQIERDETRGEFTQSRQGHEQDFCRVRRVASQHWLRVTSVTASLILHRVEHALPSALPSRKKPPPDPPLRATASARAAKRRKALAIAPGSSC